MRSLVYFFAPVLALSLAAAELEAQAEEGEAPIEETEPREEPPPGEVLLDFTGPTVTSVPEPAQPVVAEPIAAQPVLAPLPPPALPPLEPPPPDAGLAGAINQRARVGDVHRGFGIAAWIGLTATLALGSIQIYDEYGPFAANAGQTPCAEGRAIFPDFCFEAIPWPHMTAAVVTSALYYTAATMSFFFMPDPLGVAAQNNAAGERLRIHKALRWFHTIGMLLSTALGTITANLPPEDVGFDVRQGFAIAHMGIAGLTWIFLTAAALVMF